MSPFLDSFINVTLIKDVKSSRSFIYYVELLVRLCSRISHVYNNLIIRSIEVIIKHDKNALMRAVFKNYRLKGSQ